MRERIPSISLLVGVLGSIALHVTVLLPAIVLLLTTHAAPGRLAPDLRPEAVSQPQEPEQRDDVDLGIDARTPSSLTWIGYEEYEEHIAALAEVDQAAFTRTEAGEPLDPGQMPGDGLPMEPVDPLEPAEPADPADDTPPTDDAGEEPADDAADALAEAPDESVIELEPITDPLLEEPAEPHADPANESRADDGPDEIDAAPPVPDSPAQPEFPLVERIETMMEMLRARRLADVLGELPPAERESDAPSDADETDPSPTQSEVSEEDAADAEPVPDAAGEQPGDGSPPGEPDVGEPSDKEADPTSTINAPAENWRLGRPLAASGLEIKPERPHFTIIQRLTASPGNPVVEMRFRRDGRVENVRFIERSGNRSVDFSIESSLYRWRAEGEALEQLGDDQTVAVTIRIVLNPRAPH